MTRGSANRARDLRRQGGFTLIEVMLVVLLIGITVTFVNLNLGPDPKQIVKREGERVAALLRQLEDESILRGRVMALHFDQARQRYAFEVLEDGQWKPLSKDGLFYARSFAAPVAASLRIEGESARPDREAGGEEDRADGRTRIVVDPVGEITPFNLALHADGHRVSVRLDDFANVVSAPLEARQ